MQFFVIFRDGYIDYWTITINYEYTPVVGYCSAGGSCDEYIYGVELEDISNVGTGCDGYMDYSHLSANLTLGQSYNLEIIPNRLGENEPNLWQDDWLGVWIDWNGDEDFDDAGEEVFNGEADFTNNIPVNVPVAANVGSTKMRTRIVWTGDETSVSPCGITTNGGEVEDYTINVVEQQDLTLSGHIKTEAGLGISGVNVSIYQGESTTTDANGFYEFTLPTNPWDGTITPSKDCWSFDPAVRGYSGTNSNISDADFTGSPTCLYGGGLGSQEDPFLIYTAEHMQEIGANPDHWIFCFKLMEDIDLSAYTGDSFNVIGYYNDSVDNKPFSGIFDGNGKTISNFTYSASSGYYIGIFGYLYGFRAI